MPKINYAHTRLKLDSYMDPKLIKLADDLGVEAYGYYYTLIQIYGQHYRNNTESKSVEVHMRTIANTWRKRIDTCKKVLTKLQLSGMLVVTFNENTCILSIPKFFKYYGFKNQNEQIKGSNNIKEYKIIKKEKKKSSVPDFSVEVIEYLNAKCNKNFKPTTPKTKTIIATRVKEGYTVQDFRNVIDAKSQEWLHDAKMNQYLRPETLFGTKFEAYLQKPIQTSPEQSSNQSNRVLDDMIAADILEFEKSYQDKAK